MFILSEIMMLQPAVVSVIDSVHLQDILDILVFQDSLHLQEFQDLRLLKEYLATPGLPGTPPPALSTRPPFYPSTEAESSSEQPITTEADSQTVFEGNNIYAFC